MKKNLLVIYGGRSVEHDVSIITANQVMDNANKEHFEIIPVYFHRSGNFYTGSALRRMETYQNFNPEAVKRLTFTMDPADPAILVEEGKKGIFGGAKQAKISVDAAYLCLHGTSGEDGCIQGLMELANIPYTSAGVLGSAVCMDKVTMKAVLANHGFPMPDSLYFERSEWKRDSEAILDRIEGKLAYPIFIKPANLGSSVGISKATDRAGLKEAVEVACHYDRKILAEQGVENLMELNCSVMGYGADCKASLLEQPITWESFLTFEEKYMRGGKNGGAKGGSKVSGGMKDLQRKLPAPVSEDVTEKVQGMSKAIFAALDLKGVVRIDYLYDTKADAVYVGEVNTIPGSMSFYLWEPSGLSFAQQIDELVDIAIRAQKDKNENSFAYDTNLLQKFKGGGKLVK